MESLFSYSFHNSTLARSRRILDAIDELSHLLLDDDSNKLQYESLLKKLKSLKNRMEDKSGKTASHFIEVFFGSWDLEFV